jgi:amino acid transporter
MDWGWILSGALFFIIFIIIPPFSLFFGIKHIKKYRKKKDKKDLAWGIGLISIAIIILVIIIGLIIFIASITSCDSPIGPDCVNFDSNCIGTEVQATKVTNLSDDYTVTLTRTSGENIIGGVTLVFTNATETSNFIYDVLNSEYPMNDLMSNVTVTVPDVTLPNPNQVLAVVFLIDEEGNKKLCETTSWYKFA